VRVWIRTTRNTGVSLGPVALLLLGPFLLTAWVLYAAALIVYVIGRLAVEAFAAVSARLSGRLHPRQSFSRPWPRVNFSPHFAHRTGRLRSRGRVMPLFYYS